MTIKELYNHLCPFGWLMKLLFGWAFKLGLKYGIAWFFKHEKNRHEGDIENINKDLSRMGTKGVNLSKIDEYIEI